MEETVRNLSKNTKHLEKLRLSEIFSNDRIQNIDVTRKKCRLDSENIDDFRNYIKHELMVLDLVKRKSVDEKWNEMKIAIVKRVKLLFELGLQRCPTDHTFHLEFIQFCKNYGFSTTVPQAVNSMLQLFTYKPEAWKAAAEWCRSSNDFTEAFKVLKKGLENIPESTLLYDATIDMQLELLVIYSSNGKENLMNEQILNINTNIELLLNNIKNLEYVISVLQRLQKHECTKEAQNKILTYLYEHHSNEEIVWHIMAQRERKGMHFEIDVKPDYKIFEYPCLMYCVAKYTQGLSIVENERKKKLAYLYINTLIEIKNESELNQDMFEKVLALLLHALKETHLKNHLEEFHYKVWVTLIKDKEAMKILQEATEKYPQSEELWVLRLKYAIVSENLVLINSVFYYGIKVLKEKALGLWRIYLQYFMLVSKDNIVKWIFEDALKQPPEISNVLKPMYIDWLNFTFGIEEARKSYRMIAREMPYCKELHLVMSRLESTQLSVSPKCWHEVHKLAYEQFGGTDVEIGMNYIKFLMYLKPEDYEEKIKEIHKEVKENLPNLLWPQFSQMYEKLMKGKERIN